VRNNILDKRPKGRIPGPRESLCESVTASSPMDLLGTRIHLEWPLILLLKAEGTLWELVGVLLPMLQNLQQGLIRPPPNHCTGEPE
jgi:hypothetical protein